MSRLKRKILKSGAFTTLAAIAIVGGTFVGEVWAPHIMDAVDREESTKISSSFESTYGVPVEGYSTDINHGFIRMHIERSLALENAISPVKVESIKVRSNNPVFMTGEERSVVKKSRSNNVRNIGYATNDKRIVVSQQASQHDVSHEFSHNKHYNLDSDATERLQWDWESCIGAPVEDVYVGDRWKDLEDSDFEQMKEDYNLPSKYSAKGWWEDVAETRAMFLDPLYYPDATAADTSQSEYKCRAGALERAGLFVGEAPQYAALQELFGELQLKPDYTTGKGVQINPLAVSRFMAASDDFLMLHPDSVFAGNIRLNRSEVFARLGQPERMDQEFLRVLQDSQFKGGAYEDALDGLRMNQYSGQKMDADNPIIKAWDVYKSAKYSEFTGLYKYGVEPYLPQILTHSGSGSQATLPLPSSAVSQ